MSKQLRKFKRVFIFDPCFGEMTGHWENYCKRLYNELVARQYQVKVFGQRKFNKEIVGSMVFEPVFEHSPFDYTTNAFELNRASQLFLENFQKLDDTQFQHDDLFIFHSIFPQTLTAITEWTKELVTRKKVTVTLFFQFSPAEAKTHVTSIVKKLYYALRGFSSHNQKNKTLEWLDNNFVRFYQLSASKLMNLAQRGTHMLFTSTDVLSRNFSLMLGTQVHNLPMPGPKIPHDELHKNVSMRDNDAPITVGYFGHSSLAKGGQFLQLAVEKLLAAFPNEKFLLHLNPNAETEEYFNYFKTRQHPNVTCYFGHLEDKKIMSLMDQVDVIFMPYSPAKYALTPSAVFTEGLPKKKVFVLPNHTWVHEEAKKYDAGFVGFDRYNGRDICAALHKAVENFNELQNKSFYAGQKFYMDNNISNYIDMFEGILSKGK